MTAVGAAGLPAGSFVSATGICVFGIRRRPIVLPHNFNNPIRLQILSRPISHCFITFTSNFNTLIFKGLDHLEKFF